MKRLLSCAESQDLDASTRKLFGLDPLLLMEKASLRLWDRLSLYIDNSAELRAKGKNLAILALCGKGDNGGDALAMLRHARSAGFGNLKAIVSSQPLSPSAQAQRGLLLSAGMPCPEWGSLGEEEKACLYAEADIVLDGILGSGVRGAARGEALKMLEFMGTAEGSERAAPEGENQPLVVSIDLPSGLGDGWTKDMPAIKADLCLCLEPIKEICLSPSARTGCGSILSVGDVFPRDLIAEAGSSFLLEEDDLESLLEPISPESYKMSRGRVAIFAGSLGAAGAALLCAKAAIAAGAGYIYLYVDKGLYPLLACSGESFILRPLGAEAEIPECDVILAGPGWGIGEGRIPLLKALGSASERALILDADAIQILAKQPGLRASIRSPCALTPHPGEYKELLKSFGPPEEEPFSESIGALAKKLDMLVLAKSHISWIQGGNTRFVWEGMTPELGVAGSGDVLAGLFAGLLARKIARSRKVGATARFSRRALERSMEEAARAAVIAHGGAGRRLAGSSGWFDASQLVESCAMLVHGIDSREGARK